MRINFLILCAVFVAFAANPKSQRSGRMDNSDYVLVDSLWVDSTASVWTRVFDIDRGSNLTVILESRDDSITGFAADSACVDVELYQAFVLKKNNVEYFLLKKSHAHPDSTYPSSKWILWDSLDIRSMDTADVYTRNVSYDSIAGQFIGRVYGDTVKTAATTGTFGATIYQSISPDFSTGLAFKLTGQASNQKRGKGSRWIVRALQLGGEVVKQR